MHVGRATFTYGTFLTDALSFLISCLVVYYVLVLPVTKLIQLFERNRAATQRDCPECTTSIPTTARRCPECSAEARPPPSHLRAHRREPAPHLLAPAPAGTDSAWNGLAANRQAPAATTHPTPGPSPWRAELAGVSCRRAGPGSGPDRAGRPAHHPASSAHNMCAAAMGQGGALPLVIIRQATEQDRPLICPISPAIMAEGEDPPRGPAGVKARGAAAGWGARNQSRRVQLEPVILWLPAVGCRAGSLTPSIPPACDAGRWAMSRSVGKAASETGIGSSKASTR